MPTITRDRRRVRRLLLIAGTVTFAVWVALAAFLHGNPDPAAIGLAGMLVMIWFVGGDTRRPSVEADVYADAIAVLREQYATTDMTTDEFEKAVWILLHPVVPPVDAPPGPIEAGVTYLAPHVYEGDWSRWDCRELGHIFETGTCGCLACQVAERAYEGLETEREWS